MSRTASSLGCKAASALAAVVTAPAWALPYLALAMFARRPTPPEWQAAPFADARMVAASLLALAAWIAIAAALIAWSRRWA